MKNRLVDRINKEEETHLLGNKTSVGFSPALECRRDLQSVYESSDLLVSDRFQLSSASGNGEKGSPANFSLSRYAPPLHRPMRHTGNGGLKVCFFSFYSSDDVSFDVHHCNEG
ncbi:hypothetical protein AMECASPLE_011633 [Ameca splendens]|uniref:Uncharacterized protein n=1 Tax=Ameca splendens TaxID=208324 RepID=A0ABV0Z9P3_9TELE